MKLEKVLHIEDNRDLRTLLKFYLKDWGGEKQGGWFEAETLEQGVEILQREKNNFQIVIVDLNLPDSKGIATVETLRQLTIAPFVVCTGLPTEEVETRTKELGVYGVISKSKSWTGDRLRPILINAYKDWRDERLVMEISQVKTEVREVTERRERWLASHGRKA